MAEKLERFLAWRGWRTQAFSAGARRRAKLGAGSSSFFDKKSDQAGAREQVAKLRPDLASSPTSRLHLAYISR